MAWSSKRGRTDPEKFPWLRRALSEGGWRRGPETGGGEGGAAETPTDWQQLPSHVGEKKRAGPDAGTPRGLLLGFAPAPGLSLFISKMGIASTSRVGVKTERDTVCKRYLHVSFSVLYQRKALLLFSSKIPAASRSPNWSRVADC